MRSEKEPFRLPNILTTERSKVTTIINRVKEMQLWANRTRESGRTISFVPTMGVLHEGHLSLMSDARKRGDMPVVSIFVNPIQFGPSEDLSKYPRDLDGDLEKVKQVGADVVFIPNIEEIYPEGFQTQVSVRELERHLCGHFRPGHFSGVATVVIKLFNIVKPHIALFGEKDYQQLKIIQRMVKDLNMEVEVIGLPTVREKDGLALSSRNQYLSTDDKKSAYAVSRALREMKNEFAKGRRETKIIIELGREILNDAGIRSIDYLEVCDSETLNSKESAESRDLLAVAVRLGGTRLIDNMRL